MLPCPDCDREFKTAGGLALHRKAKHGVMPSSSSPSASPPPPADPPADPGADAGAGDTPPATPFQPPPTPTAKPGLLRRMIGRGRGSAGGPRASAPDRAQERAPKRRAPGRGKRIPLDVDISDVWGELGRQLESTPHYPTGRMLQYQGLGAGIVLDGALAGTLPDRILLQPLARTKDKWEDVFDLCAPPILTFMITNAVMKRNAALAAGNVEEAQRLLVQAQALGRTFDFMTRRMLVRIAPAIKQARERQAQEAEAIVDAFPELAGTDIDPVDAFRTMLWAPPEGFTPDAPTEEAHHGAGEAVSDVA